MTDLRAFYEYAQAFELAYVSDDWSVIRPYFADDARHTVVDGGLHDRDDRGGDEVVDGFREAVREYDHRFDLRVPEVIEGPSWRDGGIWMKFRLTMTRRELPDLTIEGEHLTRYENGKITSIEERVLGDGAERVAAYMRENEAGLRPLGSPVATQGDPDRQGDLDRAMMKTLVRLYGSAKSAQDFEAALIACHPDFVCNTVPFGIATRDKADSTAQFGLFFETFPEYDVAIETIIAENEHVSCWGRQKMTLGGSGFGIEPTGKTAKQEFACLFTFRDNMILREDYFFDLADMCEQLEIPIDTVRSTMALAKTMAA